MATAKELYDLRNDSALRNRVTSEVMITAEMVVNEDEAVVNHLNRMVWAKAVFHDPDVAAGPMFTALLAANSALTVAEIQGAADEQILASVTAHIDLFADGS